MTSRPAQRRCFANGHRLWVTVAWLALLSLAGPSTDSVHGQLVSALPSRPQASDNPPQTRSTSPGCASASPTTSSPPLPFSSLDCAFAWPVLSPTEAPAHARCTAPTCAPITRWRRDAGFRPLTDAGAAALVRRTGESRPDNALANAYVPTPGELQGFYDSKNDRGETAVRRNPYLADVTGHFSGTTDEIIQWAAHKWGIPEDWLRAQYARESHWRQAAMGDLRTETPNARAQYPAFSCPSGKQCYESLGISQVKWRPDGSDGAGTEPLRWKSTSFNVDYQAATVRFYYDDPDGLRSSWGDSSYRPGNRWLAIGGWFEPYPWNNPGQQRYIRDIKQMLVERTWEQPAF
jgi:hypothetical protein